MAPSFLSIATATALLLSASIGASASSNAMKFTPQCPPTIPSVSFTGEVGTRTAIPRTYTFNMTLSSASAGNNACGNFSSSNFLSMFDVAPNAGKCEAFFPNFAGTSAYSNGCIYTVNDASASNFDTPSQMANIYLTCDTAAVRQPIMDTPVGVKRLSTGLLLYSLSGAFAGVCGRSSSDQMPANADDQDAGDTLPEREADAAYTLCCALVIVFAALLTVMVVARRPRHTIIAASDSATTKAIRAAEDSDANGMDVVA